VIEPKGTIQEMSAINAGNKKKKNRGKEAIGEPLLW